MRTSIRVIEIFVRVVECGSFVAAARSLLIDPAAVSRAIKGLEENLASFIHRGCWFDSVDGDEAVGFA